MLNFVKCNCALFLDLFCYPKGVWLVALIALSMEFAQNRTIPPTQTMHYHDNKIYIWQSGSDWKLLSKRCVRIIQSGFFFLFFFLHSMNACVLIQYNLTLFNSLIALEMKIMWHWSSETPANSDCSWHATLFWHCVPLIRYCGRFPVKKTREVPIQTVMDRRRMGPKDEFSDLEWSY